MNRKPSLLPLVLATGALTLAVPAAATVDPYDGAWRFSLTPYLWVPNLNGNINAQIHGLRPAAQTAVRDVALSTEIGPNDYLENLKFGILATGEARKGLWSIFTDIIYMDFGDQKSHVRNITGPDGRALSALNRDVTTSLAATMWTLAGPTP